MESRPSSGTQNRAAGSSRSDRASNDVKWETTPKPEALLVGLGATLEVASPSIPSWNQIHEFLQEMRRLRELAIPAA